MKWLLLMQDLRFWWGERQGDGMRNWSVLRAGVVSSLLEVAAPVLGSDWKKPSAKLTSFLWSRVDDRHLSCELRNVSETSPVGVYIFARKWKNLLLMVGNVLPPFGTEYLASCITT